MNLRRDQVRRALQLALALSVGAAAGACAGGDPTDVSVDAGDLGADTAPDGALDGGDAEDAAVGDAATDPGPGDAMDAADTGDSGDAVFDADAGSDAPDDDAIDATSELDADTGVDAADAPDDVDAGAPPVFDMELIRDAATAECTFSNPRSVTRELQRLDVWDVSFVSYESVDGELRPIRMRGFAARPAGARGVPGVVTMHGLGGYATEAMATGLAALTDAFVLAPTGPGGGTEPGNTSEGRPAGYDGGYRMFDTVTDVRGSWFWGHAVGAMRALTCVATHPDVDDTRLGMTGFSGGGVATLMASGVDDRILAAVPLSGTGAWEVAMQSPNAWQWSLLTAAGLTMESPEWVALNTQLDPARVVAGAPRANVLMINGSTDEFFPLSAHVATYDAIPGTVTRRTAIAANFDHGCYSITGLESSASIEARAEIHASGGQQLWFGHWFGTDADFAYLPAEPTVSLTPMGGGTIVAAVVDPGGSRLEVESVKIWASTDALVFVSADLEPNSGVYGAIVPVVIDAGSVYYVDVIYRTRALIGARRFAISSRPNIPGGHVPNIRSITGCTP